MKNIMVTLLACLIMVASAQAANYEVSALWHFDGNMDEELGTGSTGLEWYGYDWATGVNAHSGGGALDVTDTTHGMQAINLLGDAQITGSSGFGIAMWVKRTGTSGYPAIFGFGSDSLFKMSEHTWYLGSGILLPQNVGMTSPPSGATGAALPDAATDAWSFISVNTYDDQGQRYVRYYSANASGATTGNAVYAVAAGEVLNAGNTLWLGGIAGDTRNSQCYIDELVIYNQVCSPGWAETILNATKDGDNLLILRNCTDIYLNDMGIVGDTNQDCHVDTGDFADVAESWGKVNDPNLIMVDRAANLLRIEMEGGDWTLNEDQLEQRIFNITEDPLLGGLSAAIFMDDTLLRERFADMKAHNCNSVLIRVSGVLNGSESSLHFIEVAREMGLQVYGIPTLGSINAVLNAHPEIAMLDQYGVSMDVPCVLADEYKAYAADLYDANMIATSGIDGIMWDEPAFPAWRTSYDTGRLGCYCSDCQARYQAMYGTAMPVINLPGDYGTTNWDRMMEFREAVFTEWMTFMCDTIRDVSEDFNVSIVFNPDIVSSSYGGYMTAAEATSVDVDDILQIDSLDTISQDPYWNAWGQDPSWYADFAPQFITAPHNQGKGSIFWVQAYLESQGQIDRGLHPGEVTEAIDNSLGLGCDGIFIWAYDNFSQASDYDWPEYFDEFADAVEPYLNRDAEHVTIEPVSPIAPNFDFTQLSPGRYQVNMDPNTIGDFDLKFKNAAGITRTLTFTVE